MIPRE